MRRKLKLIGTIIILLFALIGFLFTIVYVGMQFGIFNVRGSASERNRFFSSSDSSATSSAELSCINGKQICEWNETREWATVSGGLMKDKDTIRLVSQKTGVSPRLIASIVVPEQLRFFTAEREVFKRYFEPLKILGSLSKFSLGVSGIKQDTALSIEQYTNATSSSFYPGPQFAPLISYASGVDHDQELYNRLTDAKDHTYAYLYTALFIKEIEAQWKNAGYPINDNPGVIITLFNIGFKKSVPKQDPLPGGAGINTGGQTYAYGALGEKFYYSKELRDVFPN